MDVTTETQTMIGQDEFRLVVDYSRYFSRIAQVLKTGWYNYIDPRINVRDFSLPLKSAKRGQADVIAKIVYPHPTNPNREATLKKINDNKFRSANFFELQTFRENIAGNPKSFKVLALGSVHSYSFCLNWSEGVVDYQYSYAACLAHGNKDNKYSLLAVDIEPELDPNVGILVIKKKLWEI